MHRWRPFPADHLTVIDGIVTTRAARTLVDLAGVVHPKRVERAVDNCLAAGGVTLDSLRSTFSDLAGRGRKGVAVMRVVLTERAQDHAAPASELEARFWNWFAPQACRIRSVSWMQGTTTDGSVGWISPIPPSGYSSSSMVVGTTARSSTVEPMHSATTECSSAGGATSTASPGLTWPRAMTSSSTGCDTDWANW